MIIVFLQRLVEYADRLEDAPRNYVKRTVNWVVDVGSNGRWIGTGFVKLDKGVHHLVPYVERQGTGLQPILLYEKPEYALGAFLGKEMTAATIAKAAAKHESFRKLVDDCAESTRSPDVVAISGALRSEDRPPIPKEMKAGDWILFRVDGRFPSDDLLVQEFWKKRNVRDKVGSEFVCLGCGQSCAPEDRHRTPIPLRGRHTKLISANEPAYSSFGLKESLIAPTCSECARKYADSLCFLVSSETNHLVVGNLTYIFWTRSSEEVDLLMLESPDPVAVRKLLQSPKSGATMDSLASDEFYGAALSPNMARMAVRDWTETTVSSVQDRVANWFRRQQIGETERYHGIFSIVASLYPSKTRNVADKIGPNFTLHLLRHALYATRLPSSLLLQALRRCVAESSERKFTAPRMSFLKMYLLQNPRFREGDLMALDEERADPAYVCGRLMAQLERIQGLAVGNPNVTLVDRYYGTASTAPSSVFPYLLSNSQNHLAKIRRERKGLHTILSKELEGMFGLLNGFPKHLRPEEQALFAIGFYHQQQNIRAKITEMAEVKKGAI